MVSTSNHVLVNLADFGDEAATDVWAAKRSFDDDSSGSMLRRQLMATCFLFLRCVVSGRLTTNRDLQERRLLLNS